MTDILDLIYKVFEELKEAKEKQNYELASEKEAELDRLRRDLVIASAKRGFTNHLVRVQA